MPMMPRSIGWDSENYGLLKCWQRDLHKMANCYLVLVTQQLGWISRVALLPKISLYMNRGELAT